MAKNDSMKYVVLVQGCNYPNTQNELHARANRYLRGPETKKRANWTSCKQNVSFHAISICLQVAAAATL